MADKGDKKIVSTNTKTDTKVETKEDGVVVKTITTTTVDKYDDGSSSTKTQVQTITEGAQMQHIDPKTGKPSGKTYTISEAKAAAPREKVTTERPWLEQAVRAHNFYRKKHGVSKLSLNDDLCKVAQAWANKCAADEKMQHSQNGFGENIHWCSGDVENGKSPVRHWYSEVKEYDYKKDADFQKGTGHFTQVVWKDTKELGIAKAKGVKEGGTYVVAIYNPAGNLMGKLKDNVMKRPGNPEKYSETDSD
ncbi:Golgi-associated plant pathogenesis-related protein 1 isoform X2 [Folsomia candida]|nr:Golgi-associated plant pathogenesis-related protein 1 isoform X2 [Folsomia candida]XP_021963656.1 Golgi-associated plant pathogenesis-related protein 1 isoform X2 [Folsomia candida]XP_021963657.1 Golgi-associated plant pathogenesis-related protein 1 isoform X2 [Folsomia candida]XP_035715148.1 Golgi-associated plant pathogenesis-related protein 1 isoform X2 [Folsomia candida]